MYTWQKMSGVSIGSGNACKASFSLLITDDVSGYNLP